tara:strand:- start:88 stop:327 length:240 start_codon:yes stop_codon:yes gene_type:complete
MELDVPEASPDHLSNKYSPLGAALTVTVVPSLYVPSEGVAVPPSIGFTVTSNTNSFVQLESSERVNKKKSSFLIMLIYR